MVDLQMQNQPDRAPQSQRKRGRPPKTSGEAKRSSFNTRIRSKLKTRLEMEAEKAGRSLSEEIEHRLEASLLEDDARFADFGGKGGYDLFHLVGKTLRVIGEQGGKEQWWREPETYNTITEMLPGLLEAFRPKRHWARVWGLEKRRLD